MSLAYLVSYVAWIYFINDLYSEKFGMPWLSYALTAIMLFLQYNYIRCYVSDPGIIPKNIDILGKIQNANIDLSIGKGSKPKPIENAYNFLAFSNNNTKDLHLDIDNNNMSKIIVLSYCPFVFHYLD